MYTPQSAVVTPVANSVLTFVTGTQNAFTPVLSARTLIQWAAASDCTIGGLVGGVKGMIVTFKNSGTANLFIAFNAGGAAAGTRLLPLVQSGPTPVAVGGYIDFFYDGTFWIVMGHDQGNWITQPFSAGNFTASGAMTWTVAGINVTAQLYKLVGNTLHYILNVSGTTIAGTPDVELRVATPYTCGITNSIPVQVLSPGLASVLSVGGPVSGVNYIRFFSNLNGANWGAGATAITRGAWEFPVG